MPGRNGEFDSSVADETATAGYQDGMSLGGHIGSILFHLPQQAEAPSLLAGLNVDADGSRMTPTHAHKEG